VVLHRDVNSSNVLLDGDLRGKLGDFGLCAMVHQADVHAVTARDAGRVGGWELGVGGWGLRVGGWGPGVEG